MVQAASEGAAFRTLSGRWTSWCVARISSSMGNMTSGQDGVGPARRAAALAIWAASLVLSALGVGYAAAGSATPHHAQPPFAVALVIGTGFLAFTTLGLVVVLRARGHRIGWLLQAIGFLFLTGQAAEAVAKHLGPGSGAPGLVDVLSWWDAWAWQLALSLVVVTLLLFPTGSVPARRWRAVLWADLVAAAGGMLATALQPGRLDAGAHVSNPLGVAGATAALHGLRSVSNVLQLLGLVGSFAALATRYRRGEREERQQLRWLALAAGATAVSGLLVPLGAAAGVSLVAVPFFLAVVGVPGAMAVAVLRYRLYDIEIVVNRVLVFLLLTAAIAATFAIIVAGVGALVGEQQRPALSLLAAAVVAVVLNPFRLVAQRLVDRIVLGRRSTPYQVLTEFADRISGEWGAAELLSRMAGMTADATGAALCAVYVQLGDALVLAAKTPPHADVPQALQLAAPNSFDLVHPVTDHGVVLGALALRKGAGTRLTGSDERIVGYLASHAGLLLGHVRLTAELERHAADLAAQAEELRSSRERLVRAQDQERRRLERDIHDGAQQDLIAIMAKARLARNQLERNDTDTTLATIEELRSDAQQALTDLRELAHGIFPPVLADRGLVAAVQTRAARLPVAVTVRAEPHCDGDLPPDVEGAAYFVVAEAFTNVVKHAGADSVDVEIRRLPAQLDITIRDDGCGLDGATPGTGIIGMSDRVSALGGTVDVRRADPRGTQVVVSIPLVRP